MKRALLRLAAALALLAALAAPRAGPAQPYDPRLDWRTLETVHFRIHFHGGLAALARRVAGAAERAHALLVPAFAHAPAGRTEVVLSDDSDDANGSATPLPYDTIRLFAVPPAAFSDLNDERDWLEGLVTHEYVHILHLDDVEGWPRAVNAVFGKLLAPSAFSPSLVIEGLAVLHEADGLPGGDGGRNESALFDMYARALALEGPFPRLDEVVHQPLTWPRGNMAYLLGGRFFLYLRERCGADALTAFTRDQGSQLWPYRSTLLARRHLGADLATLWRDFGERDASAGRRGARRHPRAPGDPGAAAHPARLAGAPPPLAPGREWPRLLRRGHRGAARAAAGRAGRARRWAPGGGGRERHLRAPLVRGKRSSP